MRSFAVAFLIGLAVLVMLGLMHRSDLVYSPGVNPVSAVTSLAPGAEACEAPIRSPDGEPFDRVAYTVGEPGGPLTVEIRDGGTGRRLASAPGSGSGRQTVDVGTVRTRAALRVCLVNDGAAPLPVSGQVDIAAPRSTGSIDGKPAGVDFGFTLRREERSLFALAPDIAERASLFRAGWISPGIYLVLALSIIVIAPLLLARGLARAAAADRDA
jgi:hypothetical protein